MPKFIFTFKVISDSDVSKIKRMLGVPPNFKHTTNIVYFPNLKTGNFDIFDATDSEFFSDGYVNLIDQTGGGYFYYVEKKLYVIAGDDKVVVIPKSDFDEYVD